MEETRVRSLGREDPLELGLETRFSILAWRIPWTEEPVPLDRNTVLGSRKASKMTEDTKLQR